MKKNLFFRWLLFVAMLFTVNLRTQMTIGGKKASVPFSVLKVLNIEIVRLPQITAKERNAFHVKGNLKDDGLTIYNYVNPFVVTSNRTTISIRMVATNNTATKCPAVASLIEKDVITGNSPAEPNITGSTSLFDGTREYTNAPSYTTAGQYIVTPVISNYISLDPSNASELA